MKRNIKAIFSDIDGTLFSHVTKRVPLSTINAIKEAQSKGIKFFLCSGRNQYLIRKSGVLDYITPDGLVVMNGAQVIINDEIIYAYPLPESEIDVLIKFSKRLKFGLTLIEGNKGFINYVDDRVIESHEKIWNKISSSQNFP